MTELPDSRHSVRGLDSEGNEAWLIRGIASKLYRCPGCHGEVEIGDEHVIVHYVRRAGGTDGPLAWEFAPVATWETAPDPGQVAKRVIEGFTQRKLPDRAAWLISTIAHWGYGSAVGAAYGRGPCFSGGVSFVLLASRKRKRNLPQPVVLRFRNERRRPAMPTA